MTGPHGWAIAWRPCRQDRKAREVTMTGMHRRLFVGTAAGALGAGLLGQTSLVQQASGAVGELQLAPFRFDVTPPIGHSLHAGWITPAKSVEDPLEAIGFVLLGAGRPIVLCAVDWIGLLNEAHLQWRTALAEAAATTPDRVTVHCVHQHDAVFACLEAQRIVAAQGDLPDIVDPDFYQKCLDAGQAAVKAALQRPVSITHIAHGEAKVEKVAGNRRILGPDGKVISQRGSSSRNPEHRRLPEGLIDRMLKTVAFFDGDRKVAACHYYACHPMSHYGKGRVSSDFCGLARKRRQEEEPGCIHLYFNGCGGNIGAGKYNDGSPEMRPVLAQRIYDGIVGSEANLRPEPIRSLRWSTEDILPAPSPRFDESELMKTIRNASLRVAVRNRTSFTVAWIRRYEKGIPITLSALHVNDVSMLHLPAECYVEYQLRAQKMAPDRFVACAAYGDDGPWYIPTAEAYPQGGYSVDVAWCGPQVDGMLTGGIKKLLAEAP